MAGNRAPRTGRQILVRVLAALVGVVFLGFGLQERYSISHTRSIGVAAVVDPIDGYAEFEQQRPVKVIYDPRDPSEFVFEKESASWWPPLVGAGFLIAAAFVL